VQESIYYINIIEKGISFRLKNAAIIREFAPMQSGTEEMGKFSQIWGSKYRTQVGLIHIFKKVRVSTRFVQPISG